MVEDPQTHHRDAAFALSPKLQMKRPTPLKTRILLFALFAGAALAADQAAPVQARWWEESDGSRDQAVVNRQARMLPLIAVQANRFVNPAGEPVLFRGLSVADPDKLAGQGRWSRELFVAVKAMGANLVRLPVHPVAWRQRTPAGYLALLDQAVAWCTELGMHVIIDWHSIGNLKSGMFQAPMYETSPTETLAFWRTVARHFQGHNTVAFYELFNEPTRFHGRLGRVSWTEWRELNEEIIDVIRHWDRETIPLVAGFDWAYDLTPLHYEPVRAEGIGYVTHPYAFKRPQPWEPRWEENFAFAAERYPLIATEWGFDLEAGETVDDRHYGNRLTRFLEQRGISWTAWSFDSEWGPRMLRSFDGFALNGFGEFVKQALQRPASAPETKPANKPGGIH